MIINRIKSHHFFQPSSSLFFCDLTTFFEIYLHFFLNLFLGFNRPSSLAFLLTNSIPLIQFHCANLFNLVLHFDLISLRQCSTLLCHYFHNRNWILWRLITLNWYYVLFFIIIRAYIFLHIHYEKKEIEFFKTIFFPFPFFLFLLPLFLLPPYFYW